MATPTSPKTPESPAQAPAKPADPGLHTKEELDDLLDEALDETFPASDPIAVHKHVD